jgi:DNA-binding HxlR family transcriptional regulator
MSGTLHVVQETKKIKLVLDDHAKRMRGKWTYILIFIINRYPVKFNKIKQLLPEITSRTLSLALGKLQSNGFIIKESDTYKITKLGKLTLDATLDYIEKAKALDIK